MSTLSDFSIPDIPPLSPGSSVSTRLQDEYDELLKFAVVVPQYDPKHTASALADPRDSFLQSSTRAQRPNRTQDTDVHDISDATDVTPINTDRTPRDRLPDFGNQSPISSIGDRRPHDPIPSHYLSAGQREQDRNQSHNESTQVTERDREMEKGEYERVYTATVDPDVSKMETMMDQWCLDLKRNVIAEFSQSKIRIVEQGRHQLIKEQERHASEKIKLVDEINSLKELLATYEKSIERKDQVISNLTNAMSKQRDKLEMMKKFGEWKLKHNDYKREAFCSRIADKHYRRQLSQKAWDAWHSIIVSKWRQRLEKACQAKAQEVCVNITNDYEAKLAAANEALSAAHQELASMQREKDRYEEAMKKAFMRGVCALNLEAMTIFHGEEKENQGDNAPPGNTQDLLSENMKESLPMKDFSHGKSIPQDSPRERIVTSEGSRPSTAPTAKTLISKTSRPASSKVVTTKVSGKVDCGRGRSGLGQGPLAPPMSSVVVERHQPVTKQTMGHAIAGRFPRVIPEKDVRGVGSGGGSSHRKIAGQSGKPVLQTVKHVE